MERKDDNSGRTSTRFRSEFFIAISAIVVSVMSMIVAVYQTNIMRQQQYSSVWPYVEWIMSTGTDGFSITVMNKGVGPAIIKSTALKFDGQPAENVDVMLTKIFGPLDSLSRAEAQINNRVLAPGEQLQLFHIFDSPAVRKVDHRIYERIQYEICYCSIYGECWTSKGLTVVEGKCD